MNRLLVVLVVCFVVSASCVFGAVEPSYDGLTLSEKAEVKKQSKRFTAQIRAEIEDGRMDTLAKKTDEAIENLVNRGIERLEEAGDREAAHFYRFIYRTEYSGYVTRMVAHGGYDIGDHAPLSQWLADFYNRLELILGIAVCKSLHLSDIKTINHSLPIVFKPCSFPMDSVGGERIDEYRRHFNAGEVYYGLIPVVAYWLVDAPCMLFTSGIAAFLCGPIAGGVEYAVSITVGPKLSDWVFTKSCSF